MSKPDRRKQRRLEARALQAARPKASEELAHARRLAGLPMESMWISESWRFVGLAVCVVVRRRPDGDLAVLSAIADLGCLGIKDVAVFPSVSPAGLDDILARATRDSMLNVPIGVGVQLLRESARWCEACGMPERDSQTATLAFLSDEVGDSSFEIPLGHDGKPMLVPGPHDDFNELAAILAARFGSGGFHFTAPA